MIRFLEYALRGIGLLSLVILLSYQGSMTSLRVLCIVLIILATIGGSYMLALRTLRARSQRSKNSNNRLKEIDCLKRSGDRVQLTLDNAEVKSSSYQQEVISEEMPTKIEMIDAWYDGARNYKTKSIVQTYVVVTQQYGGKLRKYVSPALALPTDVVVRCIEAGESYLYMDPENPERYFFDNLG